MKKKWWILAVVFTLALSLTSCSGGTDSLQSGNAGQLTCNGSKGSFTLILNQTGYGTYDLEIDPNTATPEGILTQIAFVDTSGDTKVVDPEESLFSGRPVHISNVNIDDLQNFSYLVMATYNPNLKFLQMTAPTFCKLPFPGDSSSSNGDGN